MNIIIKKPNGRLSEEQVAELENSLGVRFPVDYRSFLGETNGGIPETNEFVIPNANNGSGVNEFLSAQGIKERKKAMANRLPRAAYPIAYAEGGNLVCLVAGERDGVYYWDHELEVDEGELPGWQNMFLLGQSFDEFFSALRKFDPSSVELKPGQVKSSWIDPDFLNSLHN